MNVARPCGHRHPSQRLGANESIPYVWAMSAPTSDAAYGEQLYDLFNDGKDYAADASYLHRLVTAHRPSAKTWLDVACGTGRHLAALACSFEVAGVDVSASMLASARRHVGPDVPLHQGSFRDFELGMTFDVVSCRFSSICHAEDVAGLHRAIGRMAAHVNDSGLLLVERYFDRDQFDDSRVGVHHVEHGELRASQYHTSRAHRTSADLHIHYVLARPGSIEHYDLNFRVGLFSDTDFGEALADAGLDHRVLLGDALSGRGLYVCSRCPLDVR